MRSASRERLGAGRDDHELLQVEPVLRVRAAVDDVHERHREHVRVGRRRASGTAGTPASAAAAFAAASEQPRIAFAPSLLFVRRPVELDEHPVDLALIARRRPRRAPRRSRRRRSRPPAARPCPDRARVAVAELDRLVLARRRARGDRRTAEGAGAQSDVDLERRVAARVQDLAGVDVRRSPLITSGFLRALVVRVLLVEPEPAPLDALAGRDLARALDTLDEPFARRAQRELGIDVQLPGDVDDGEEEVADLVEGRGVGLRLGRGRAPSATAASSSSSSSWTFANGPSQVRPVVADRRRTPLHLARLQQRGERLRGRRGRCPRGPPARSSAPPSARGRGPAVRASASPKTCGWRRTSFSWTPRATASRSPSPRSSSRSERKYDLEEQVAELPAQPSASPASGGVGDLVRLLDGVRHDRARGLLAIPGALAAKVPGQLLEVEERLGEAHGPPGP